MMKKFFYIFLLIILIVEFYPIVTISATLRGNVYVDYLKIPVGTPTGGYAQSKVANDPESPYAQDFPATRGIHTKLRIKTLLLDDGIDRVYILSVDTIGSADFLTKKVIKTVKERTNGTLDPTGKLIITATHTHAGPGRLSPHPLWTLAMDKFSQEIFNIFVDGIANSIIKVSEKLEQLKLGIGEGENAEIINDRRCENPELKDPTMYVIRIDKIDGAPFSALINFNIHGTVNGADNHYFSVDAPGLIEEKFEERFNSPIVAMFIQSSAGDIAPVDPKNHSEKWDRMESIGELGSQTAFDIYNKIETSENVDLAILSKAIPLNRAAIGYKGTEFNYKYGAGFCGMGAQACDNDFKTKQLAMRSCPFFGKEYGILYTRISVMKINDAIIVTLPGEPNTSLRMKLEEEIKKEFGKDKVMSWGYSQDHLGYLLLPDDWWQGGYEAAMNSWGWKLGEYLISQLKELVKSLDEGVKQIVENPELEKLGEFEDVPYSPVPIGKSINGGMIKTQPEFSSDKRYIKFSWYGGDSGIDFPMVHFERFENGAFQPVMRKNGLPFDDSTYETFLNYFVSPTYGENPSSEERSFIWELLWNVKHIVPAPMDPSPGMYRMVAKGKFKDKNGNIKDYTLYSNEFIIE